MRIPLTRIGGRGTGRYAVHVRPQSGIEAKPLRGTLITEEMLVAKKPATGIPVGDADAVIGRTLARDVTSDRLIAWDDLRVDG